MYNVYIYIYMAHIYIYIYSPDAFVALYSMCNLTSFILRSDTESAPM